MEDVNLRVVYNNIRDGGIAKIRELKYGFINMHENLVGIKYETNWLSLSGRIEHDLLFSLPLLMKNMLTIEIWKSRKG